MSPPLRQINKRKKVCISTEFYIMVNKLKKSIQYIVKIHHLTQRFVLMCKYIMVNLDIYLVHCSFGVNSINSYTKFQNKEFITGGNCSFNQYKGALCQNVCRKCYL